ncbi:uncharacterized protein LOC141899539 [Tubulanus polymorphus]|uniref:uncharacterized protein LOC141899539 n=1 Tax=Tubulanus polymorphus TaxID=672921 RepID=UPI003DA60C59
MEDVNSCIVCKALCGESEFEDVTGSLLETIVKVKVLAELPFMLEPGTLSNRTDLKICRVCKGILEKIQDNIKHLKDRVARRRVNFARMQFRQSRSVNCERDADHGPHLSAELNCDSDGGSRDKLGLGLRQSSNESKESNSPCTVLSHTSCVSETEQLDQCREVRIRVPPSINATFIVLESSDNLTNDKAANSGGQNLLRSLIDQNDPKVTDVIATASYEKPHHVNLNAFEQKTKQPFSPITTVKNEVKHQAPIINVTSCDDNSSDSVRSSHNGHSLQHAGSVDIPVHHSNDMKRKRPLTTQSRSFDEDSRAKLARLEQLQTESNTASRSLTASPNPNHANRHVLLSKKLSPDVKALDLSLRTPGPGQPYTLCPNTVSLASLSPTLLRSMPLQHNKMSNSFDSLTTQLSHSFDRGASMERQNTEDSVVSFNSEDPEKESLHVSGEQDGKYPCEICGKNFEKKSFWKRHVVWYHNDQAYTCLQCGGKFAERFSLQIHESHEHGMNSTIPVNVPDQMLNQTQSRDNNLQKSRKKIQYCAQCHEHFTSKYDLLRHRVTTGHMGGAGGVCSDREEEELVNHTQKTKSSMSRLSPSSLITPKKLQHSWSANPYDSLMPRNTLTAPNPLIKTKGVSLDTGLAQAPIDETPVVPVTTAVDDSCDNKDLLGFRNVTMVKAASMDSGLNRGCSPASDEMVRSSSMNETNEQYVYSKEGNHLRVLEGPNVK